MGKPFSINSFRSAGLSSGGARPSLFEISWGDTGAKYTMSDKMLVKAGSIPTSNIAPLAVNYGGRAYKLQGFRTFDVWTVTVLQDEDFTNRMNIVNWMQKISGQMDGSRQGATTDTDNTIIPGTKWDHDGTALVTQFAKDGKAHHTYKFYNLWPTELAEIPLDWASDQIEEYTVTFCYDYWTHGDAVKEKTDDILPTGDPKAAGGAIAPTSAAATTG